MHWLYYNIIPATDRWHNRVCDPIVTIGNISTHLQIQYNVDIDSDLITKMYV